MTANGRRPTILMLCTGNAARSVMASVMLRSFTEELDVIGAGTHVIEGQPMSGRTRDAIAELGYADPHHRSRQLTGVDAAGSDLIVAFAPEHVAFVRRRHPEAAARTATIKRLARDLPAVAPSRASLADRVAAMDLAAVEVESWEEVVDPAGGDLSTFRACAGEVHELVIELHRRL